VSIANHEAAHYAIVSSLRSSLRPIMRDEIPHPYNTTRKVTGPCILILVVLDSTKEDKIPWAKESSKCSPDLICY